MQDTVGQRYCTKTKRLFFFKICVNEMTNVLDRQKKF